MAGFTDFHSAATTEPHPYDCYVTVSRDSSVDGRRPLVPLGHLELDAMTESQVLDRVAGAIAQGVGGSIVTPNVDIWLRSRRDPEIRALVQACDIIVADGAPLMWSAALAGTPLPQRIAGSALVESLAQRGAAEGWSVFIIGGGDDGTADRAVSALVERYPALSAVGAVTPPFGFEHDTEVLAALVAEVATSGSDLVFIGLGFPKQERLAALLARRMPCTWFLGCGAGVQMAAGVTRRPPAWVQAAGGEWIYRLVQDPRHLARRYLVDDIPAALLLLGGSVRTRLRKAVRRDDHIVGPMW